jgi:DNA primase
MAGKIPREFIDDLIARVDLVDLIDARVPLKKAGANYLACCPFHNEKSPSFNVNREKQFYHCFGCGASGNAIGFLMNYERQSFIEAVETLVESLGLEIPREAGAGGKRVQESAVAPLYEVQAQAAAFFARQLREHPDAARARDYLQQRGLDTDSIKRFELGYAPPGWRSLPESFGAERLLASGLAVSKEGGGFYDRFRDRIMFPIRDRRGRVVGFGGRVMGDEKPKYLNSPETPVFKKSREVYGLNELLSLRQKTSRILVVEGYMDVISLAQHGIPYAVATLGTATSADHANLLFRYAKELAFCFDGDLAGRAAAWKALEASLPALREGRSIRFLMLPQEHDPDSLVREEGQAVFESRLEEAQPLSDYFFQHLSEDLNLGSLEGKASLFQAASPLLGKLPAGVFRDMMHARLAKLSGHGAAQPRPGQSQATRNYAPAGLPERGKPSNLRIVLAMLIQNPGLFALLDAESRFELEREEKAGPLARRLFAVLDEKPGIKCGGLLERFRGEAEEKLVKTLGGLEIPLSESDTQTEFRHTLDKFVAQAKNQLREERLEWLNRKLASVGFAQLDEAEREEYRRLVNPKNL